MSRTHLPFRIVLIKLATQLVVVAFGAHLISPEDFTVLLAEGCTVLNSLYLLRSHLDLPDIISRIETTLAHLGNDHAQWQTHRDIVRCREQIDVRQGSRPVAVPQHLFNYLQKMLIHVVCFDVGFSSQDSQQHWRRETLQCRCEGHTHLPQFEFFVLPPKTWAAQRTR